MLASDRRYDINNHNNHNININIKTKQNDNDRLETVQENMNEDPRG